jgi:glycosyltransferase involved in cell wall biosynthesis
MKLSVVIPFHNDFEVIHDTIISLLWECNHEEAEIIVVNDGSVFPNNRFRPLEVDYKRVIVVNNPVNFGVGYSIDRGVEEALGDIIVICGADIQPRQGWYEKVISHVAQTPDTLGCAVCVNKGTGKRHYGAELLIQVGKEDLPENSPLRNLPTYTALFEAQWRKTEGISEGVNEGVNEGTKIPCALGAFYWTSKRYYQFIGGFDTKPNTRWRGHQNYGSLESYISLKSWLGGGGVTLYPDIEAEHLFSRADGKNKFTKGLRSADRHWFNRLTIAHTMVHDERLLKSILNYPLPELNLNTANKHIQRSHAEIELIRERNKLIFTRDMAGFMEMFNYKLK